MGRWYILKPGFADRAQGIRLFSTEAELYVTTQAQSEADMKTSDI
jgi:hypothetical protein